MLLESITLTRRQMLATATVFLETELLKPKKRFSKFDNATVIL